MAIGDINAFQLDTMIHLTNGCRQRLYGLEGQLLMTVLYSIVRPGLEHAAALSCQSNFYNWKKLEEMRRTLDKKPGNSMSITSCSTSRGKVTPEIMKTNLAMASYMQKVCTGQYVETQCYSTKEIGARNRK